MKKRNPKAWDLNNVINFLWRVQYELFLTQFFPLIHLRSCGTTKICLMRDCLCKRDLAFCSENYMQASEHSCIQSPSQDHMKDLNSHLWCCVFLYFLSWGDSGPPKHRVCRHLPTEQSRAQSSVLSNGSGFWLQWEKCQRANLVESPSFLQSSSCFS